MTTIIDEPTTDVASVIGRRALWKSAANPRAGRKINRSYIQSSESAIPVAIPWQETLGKMYGVLANHYGVDVRML